MTFYRYDRNDIRGYLEQRNEPVSEAALLRHLTGKSRLPSDREDLYDIHFSLYHALYRLKESEGLRGVYLHLDPMRIMLVPAPEPGRCTFYFPPRGRYCADETGGGPFCARHLRENERIGTSPVFDPMREFYLNPDNISFGKSELLRRLLNGVMIYSFRMGEIEEALKFFDLTNPDKKIIQRRYRELARRYHPDLNGFDDGRMKILNHSYQILREVFLV